MSSANSDCRPRRAQLVDLSQFRYRERAPLRPRLVCTRGFSKYYSVDVVVKAFAEVKKEYPEAQLDLVGGGRLEGDIRKLVADMNLTGVNFTGVASRQEIGKYYDEADIFINASWLDNMPLSVIEAFASGTPVVTTSPECMPISSSTSAPDCYQPWATKKPSPQMSSVYCAIPRSPLASRRTPMRNRENTHGKPPANNG